MNKYYYVPVTSRHIKYDDLSLLDVTGTIDFLLKDRELGRVEMLDGDKTSDSSSLEMKQALSPERLILIKDKNGVREMYTDSIVEASDNYLSCFEINASKVLELIDDDEYFNLALNYFGMYNYRKNGRNKANTKK